MTALTTTRDKTSLIELLRSSIYPGARDEMIALVLSYCRMAGLDPFQRPVHIVPIWDQRAQRMREIVMPGIGLYRTQAARSGDYAGISEPEFGPDVTLDLDGQTVTFPMWCRITVRRRLSSGYIAEFTAREFWIENYVTAGKDTTAPNKMWARRPYGMLAKCAEAQALRKAFPELLGTAPIAEEVGSMDEPMLDATHARDSLPATAPSLPPYPADRFAAQLPRWAELIATGRKTPEEILATVSSKYSLTDEQRAAIYELAADTSEGET